MAIITSKVVVQQSKPNWNIAVVNRGGALLPSTGIPTAPNYTPVAPTSVQVSSLQDVNLTANPPVNGSTLVYNSSTQKYDVGILPSLDGGAF
jgi:hypothetical protein